MNNNEEEYEDKEDKEEKANHSYIYIYIYICRTPILPLACIWNCKMGSKSSLRWRKGNWFSWLAKRGVICSTWYTYTYRYVSISYRRIDACIYYILGRVCFPACLARNENVWSSKCSSGLSRSNALTAERNARCILGFSFQFSCVSRHDNTLCPTQSDGWCMSLDLYHTAKRCAYRSIIDIIHMCSYIYIYIYILMWLCVDISIYSHRIWKRFRRSRAILGMSNMLFHGTNNNNNTRVGS